MPVKPPRGGGTHVDVPDSLHRAADADISLHGHPGRTGVDGNFASHHLLPRAESSSDATLDAIPPAAAVVVRALAEGIRPPATQPSLDNYVTNARAILPQVNSEGLRVISRRTYADLVNGDLVPVAVDPATGLYRARRPSELLPSGPVMLRDVDSGLWYAREVAEPTTREQIRKYLPDTTDEDADAFIARFDDKDGAELELKHIQLGLAQLDSTRFDLPISRGRISSDKELHEARNIWATFRQLYRWQGQPEQRVYRDGRHVGFKLEIDLTIWPVQKPLSLKFSSVISLTLRGRGRLDPDVFCAQFPNLESLTITSQAIEVEGRFQGWNVIERAYSKFRLDSRFAEQLKRFPRLQRLHLQDCELTSDFFRTRPCQAKRAMALQHIRGPGEQPGHADAASGASHLLQVAADIRGMTELRVLDLSRTGIHLLPSGLEAIDVASKLEVLRLGAIRFRSAPHSNT